MQLARIATEFRSVTLLAFVAALFCMLPAKGISGDDVLVAEILHAADRGDCIENVTYRLIQQLGPSEAGIVVQSALVALERREHQQRALGCAGDIAAQAIAAGADPEQVLEATAAGL